MRISESDAFASSSAESSTACVWKYDVFLSFRAPDTLKGITFELYDRMQNRGIKTFKDDRDLEVGDVIPPTLLKTIGESRFAIVVLSPNYASSTCCLEELAKICECMEDNNRILPLFYNVDPTDVRYQLNSFGDAFTKHERSGRHRSEKVQQWRDALKKVASFSGWDSKTFVTDRQLVEDIVESVYSKVQPIEINEGDFQEFEATRQAMNEVMKALKDDKVTAVGVYGMGGVGKTSMVKRVGAHSWKIGIFHHVIMGVVSQIPDLIEIQGTLAELLGVTLMENTEIGRAARLRKEIMRREKVLIILDDVWSRIELSDIGIPSLKELENCNSKLLLTTRRKNVCHSMGCQEEINLNVLSQEDSWILFMRTARRSSFESAAFENLARKVAATCSGLPVVLIAFAKALADKGLAEWERVTTIPEKMQRAHPDDEDYAAVKSEDDLKNFIDYQKKEASLDASKTFKEKNWPATPLTCNSDFWHLAPQGLEHLKNIIEDAIQGTFDEKNRDKLFTRFLVPLKSTQLITVAMLVVANVLQKCESIYKFEEQCFELLGDMAQIANLLLGIESRKIEMGDSLIQKLCRRSMNCIMDGFWLCCSAMGASPSYTRGKEDFYAVTKNMLTLKKQLTTCKTINKNSLKLEQVTDLLELEADTNAIAVVLQGYGGLGKTTLADAVFSNVFVDTEEFLCSKVEISQNCNSISHIIELQENILKGLLGDEEVSVSSDSEGRSKIGCLLKEAAVFIYIDNIMPGIDLRKLLPGNLGSAKRLRLLFTTRDSDLCGTLKLSRPVKVYEMKRLSEQGAMWYLKRNLSENAKDRLTSRNICDLSEISVGIPSILQGMIKRLNDHEGDIHTECLKIINEDKIGRKRETLMEIFGLEHLEKEAKEALLDICAYFQYHKWEIVKLIFRPDVLASLTSRSLAIKEERNCIRMHPALRNLNRVELETTRITPTSDHPQLSGNKEADVKGIWVTSNIHIAESLLDNVSGSLRVLRLGSPNKCEECLESLIYLTCPAPMLLTAPNLRYLHIWNDASISPTLGDQFQVELNTFRKLKIVKLEHFLQLRSLPDSIGVLSELQVLELRGWSMLQDLGNGFYQLSALQALSLPDCPELSGILLDYILNLSSLRYLDIRNSTKLEERWKAIDPLCYEQLFHLVVQTSEADDELLERISKQFPGPQEFKVDRDREAFDITKLVRGSNVFFIVDYGTAPSLVWLLQEIAETCDENVQIVYIGHHLRELSPQILDRISGFSHIKSTAHRLLQLYYNTSKIREWSSPKEKHFTFLMSCTIQTGSEKSRFISCNKIADEKKTMLEIVFSSSKKKLILQDVKELFNFKEELCYGFETEEISICRNSGKQIILLVMLTVGIGLIDTALEASTSFQKYKTLSSTSDTHDYYFLYLPDSVIDEEIMEMKEWMKKNCPSIVPIEKPWSLRPYFTFLVRELCRSSTLAAIDIKDDGEIVSLTTFC